MVPASLNAMELPLTIANDSLWKNHPFSRGSFFSLETRLPNSEMNESVDGPKTPEVSKASGWKMYALDKPEYLAALRFSASAAAEPPDEADL